MIDADPLGQDNLRTRSPSELGRRVGSALVMAAAALLATWSGGWPFTLLWLAAACVILQEWIDMSRAAPRSTLLAIGGVGLILLAGILRLGGDVRLVLAVTVATAAALAACAAGRHGRVWGPSGFLYAALALAVPVFVRDRDALGAPAILWIFAVVWLTDIGGYFVGRFFGGPKLAPSISPGKTWSGFAGGLVAATAAGVAVVWLAGRQGHPLPVGWPPVIVASLLASVAGQLGDLAESAMKRFFAVKDSGHLIPGHGGLMDRLDGFVTAGALLALVLTASDLSGLGS